MAHPPNISKAQAIWCLSHISERTKIFRGDILRLFPSREQFAKVLFMVENDLNDPSSFKQRCDQSKRAINSPFSRGKTRGGFFLVSGIPECKLHFMENDVISASRRSDDRKTPRTERYMERTFCVKIRAAAAAPIPHHAPLNTHKKKR